MAPSSGAVGNGRWLGNHKGSRYLREGMELMSMAQILIDFGGSCFVLFWGKALAISGCRPQHQQQAQGLRALPSYPGRLFQPLTASPWTKPLHFSGSCDLPSLRCSESQMSPQSTAHPGGSTAWLIPPTPGGSPTVAKHCHEEHGDRLMHLVSPLPPPPPASYSEAELRDRGCLLRPTEPRAPCQGVTQGCRFALGALRKRDGGIPPL